MKKLLILLLTLTLCLAVLCACNEPDNNNGGGNGGNDGNGGNVTDLSGVTFAGAEFTYDGTQKSLSAENLPEGVSVTYDGNGKTDAGEYTVTAKFYKNNEYLSGKDKTATLKIKKATYDMSGITFPDGNVTYNGNVHSIYIRGNLPFGVNALYTGNGKTDAGEYTVTASFPHFNANYEPIASMTATLSIAKATYTPQFITELYFNGDYQSASVAGTLPAGITVEFSDNTGLLPGEYTITASFTVANPNYNSISDKSLTLTICESGYVTDKSDLGYQLLGNGTYEITEYKGSKPAVVLPDKIEGVSVCSIATNAFLDENIAYIEIPNSVTNIGNASFKNSSLRAVKFGNGIANIGASAFAGTALTEVILPDSLTSIGLGAFKSTPLTALTLPFIGGSHTSSNDFLGYIFGSTGYFNNARDIPATLKSVTLSNTCEKIPAYAFFGCTGIEEITIGSGVKSIGNMAFSGCTAINSIYIPETVTDIYANVNAYDSPFYNASAELKVVFGHADASRFGQYFLNISDTETAEAVFGKTYSEYLTLCK